jgi:hypothetical protein
MERSLPVDNVSEKEPWPPKTGTRMMNKLIVDAETRKKLYNLAEPLQLVDESGKILGNFTPVPTLSPWEPQISEQEIERRLRAGGGRSLAEILKCLESCS